MPVRIVQSKQNARFKQLRRALSHPGRDAPGLIGIEGPNLVKEALRAGLRIECIFAAQEAEHLLEGLSLTEEMEILMMPAALLDGALATENPQPVAALVEAPDWTWAHLVNHHRKVVSLIVVLAGVQDPGNLGTIVRSAEAFGADGVVALPGTVSQWNPKAVRASAGSLFRLPFLTASAEVCFKHLREAGVRILTSTVRAAEPADLVDLTGPVALILGNEGNGVPVELAKLADGAVTIPCPGMVDSLNAAVAGSVLLYEASRQRIVRSGRKEKLRGSVR